MLVELVRRHRAGERKAVSTHVFAVERLRHKVPPAVLASVLLPVSVWLRRSVFCYVVVHDKRPQMSGLRLREIGNRDLLLHEFDVPRDRLPVRLD